MHDDITKLCNSESSVYIEGIYDASGSHGIYLFFPSGKSFVIIEDLDERAALLERLFSSDRLEKVVFGFRSLVEVGLDETSSFENVTDVEILYDCSDLLPILVRKHLSERDYEGLIEAALKFDVHVKAAKKALVPLDHVRLFDVMPKRFFESLYRMRAVRALALRAKRPQSVNRELMNLAVVLSRAERDGYVSGDQVLHPSFNVVGGKTKRISLRAGSPNCMSIPHGAKRKLITSRFENGSVCSMDFNAIDYRCIVSSDSVLREMYGDCDDFHVKTVEILTGKTVADDDIRNLFKQLTYMHFYGGTKETIQKNTGLSTERLDKLLSLFDSKLGRVKELRTLISTDKVTSRFGIDLSEHQVHDGAKLALFAQTCSSYVFKACVVALGNEMHSRHMKSKLMFTVHDEVDIDVHPDELTEMNGLARVMEQTAQDLMGIRFVVKVKIGKDYDEAS